MGAIRVLVVDDSPFFRRAVQRMLDPLREAEIIAVASNGREAVEAAVRHRPDIIILDIIMPEMNGLEAISEIMDRAPTAILVLSSETRPGAETTLRALELGAVDFVSKSDAQTRMDIYDLAPILREKVRAVAGSRVPQGEVDAEIASAAAVARTGELGAAGPPAPDAAPPPVSDYDLLVVGASTGGPRALARILSEVPADFPAGIVIAQHMPPGFTRTLAERLDRRSALEVREACDGDLVRPGLALVGPGGSQIRLERRDGNGRDIVVRIREGTAQQLHQPSVDLLMMSAAEAAGSRAVGVVLTGMGQDGARGLEALRRAGARTFAESESTAVIFGMPRAAAESAERAVPLHEIPALLRSLFRGKAA